VSEVEIVKKYKIWNVIAASSAGTLIERYDFYIFGSLAPILSDRSFSGGIVSDKDSLYFHVPSLSHRERHLRRACAAHWNGSGPQNRQSICRTHLSNLDCTADLRHRLSLRRGHQECSPLGRTESGWCPGIVFHFF